MDLFDNNLTVMQRALDLRMQEQRVTASNIANVDTPGFVAKKLDFDASLQAAISNLEPDAAPAPLTITESLEAPGGLDGNNVNVESELATLSRTKMMYSVTTQLVGAKFRQLSTALEQSN